MKKLFLIALAAISTSLLSAQSSLTHGNSDVTVDDGSTLNDPNPQIFFDLGFPGDPDLTDCYTQDWEWRYISYRLEPNETKNNNSLFIGTRAGNGFTTANDPEGNTFLGFESGLTISTGEFNTGLGNGSLSAITTGSENVSIGYLSQGANSTNSNNVSIGDYTLGAMTDGRFNTVLGHNAAGTADNVEYNVIIGERAFRDATNSYQNTAIGSQAMLKATNSSFNIALGRQALMGSTTGITSNESIAIGNLSMNGAQNSSNDISIGALTMSSIPLSTQNIAIGEEALQGNGTTGAGTNLDENIAIGRHAASLHSLGNLNIYVGSNSGRITGASAGTNPRKNVVMGYNSGAWVDGSRNVIIGAHAGGLSSDGTPGVQTNANDILSGNVIIGHGAASQDAVVNSIGRDIENELWIENSDDPDPLVWGDFSGDILRSNGEFQIYDPTGTGYKFPTAHGTAGQILKLEQNGGEWELVWDEDCGCGKSLDQGEKSDIELLLEKIEALEQKVTELEKTKPQSVNLGNSQAIFLGQNSPNPFMDQTVISYDIPENVGKAEIRFFDQQGTIIKTVSIVTRGQGSLIVYAEDLSAAIYNYSLVADGKVITTKRMVKSH